MEPKAYKIEEMVEGGRWFYECEEQTPKGERLVVELCVNENPGGDKSSIPALWHKHGYTPTELSDWWSVQTYVYDAEGNCYGRYNPTIKREEARSVIDFDWMLPATEANREKILREIERRAFGEGGEL